MSKQSPALPSFPQQSNYDLLRILAILAVVLLHANGGFIVTRWNEIQQGTLAFSQYDFFLQCAYNMLSRFSIPVFLMLSGAFLLAKPETKNYAAFYKKSFYRIGIPGIIAIVGYMLYNMCLIYWHILPQSMTDYLSSAWKGTPATHLWYLYMLVGVYALMPVGRRFVESVSLKQCTVTAFIFLLCATFSNWNTDYHDYQWTITKQICYFGYVLVGYVIRQFFCKRIPSPRQTVVLFLTAFIMGLGLSYLSWWQANHHILFGRTPFSIGDSFFPLTLVYSLLVFAAFASLEIKFDFSKLAGLTYGIYLIHFVFLHAFFVFYKHFYGVSFVKVFDGPVIALLLTFLTFGISAALVSLVKKH